jgi:hypothetical protein
VGVLAMPDGEADGRESRLSCGRASGVVDTGLQKEHFTRLIVADTHMPYPVTVARESGESAELEPLDPDRF